MQRKIYLLVILLITTFITTKVIAQTTGPDGVIFQAVATDPQGNPAANRTIYIKDAILQTTATGTVVYSETFQVTASSTGVFTIVIGKGQRLSGPTSIGSLDWSAGPYFLNLKAAVAPSVPLTNWNVDQQYVDMGTSQFWTVPFALFASKVAGFDLKLNIADTTNMLKPYLRKSDTATLSARIDATKLAVTQETARAIAAEALKANTTDKSVSITTDASSDIKYPSVKSVKTYVDAQVFSGPQGVQGIQGLTGLTGATGAIGAQGATGSVANVGTISGSSTANGATITSGVLSLTPADGTNGGIVTTGTQTFAGSKIFSSDINVNGVIIGRGLGNDGANVAIGASALASGTGTRNTAVGYGAMRQYRGTSFDNNSSLGYYNMLGLTTGAANTSMGGETMFAVGAGSNNTAIGNHTLMAASTSGNSVLGASAGNTISTGSLNTIIGYGADVLTGGLDNATAIGSGTIVSTSNTIQLGNTSVNNVKTSGTITADAVTYPKAHGTAGQVLSTTGSGTLAWTTPAGGVNLYQKTNNSTTLTSNVQNLISLSLPAGSYLVTYTGMAYAGTSDAEYVASRIAISNPGNLGGEDAIMVNGTVNDGRAYVVNQLVITLTTSGSVSVWANNIYGTSNAYLFNSRLTAVQVGSVIDQ